MSRMMAYFVAGTMIVTGTSCSWLKKDFPMNLSVGMASSQFVPPPNFTSTPSVLFVGDPQIHNIYGVSLKQGQPSADKFVRVAIRPPEVNLLAKYALTEILRQGQEKKPDLVVVLGDGTNVACSNEYDIFARVMRGHDRDEPDADGRLWLMAHGNHDSYMQGMQNSYVPTSDTYREPALMPRSVVPTDESWWLETVPLLQSQYIWIKNNWLKSEKHKAFQNYSWNYACYAPSSESDTQESKSSLPMNKVQWLAKYFAELKPHGLTVVSSPIPDKGPSVLNLPGKESDYRPQTFRLKSDRVTGKLAAMNYRMEGRWTRPDFSRPPGKVLLQEAWRSFVVQSIDLSPGHRLVLIDTSVCEDARGLRNAGQHGCIGAEQMMVIARLAKSEPGVKVTIAGHFPLKDLSEPERLKLFEIMEQSQPWDYVSAHTHEPVSRIKWNGGVELNIGSTTDWPAEGHVVHFSPTTGRIADVDTLFVAPTLTPYQPYKQSHVAEICRHLPAAKALAELDVETNPNYWPVDILPRQECNLERNEDWLVLRRELDHYLRQIDYRMKNQADYKEAALKIFAGASFQESTTDGLIDRIN